MAYKDLGTEEVYDLLSQAYQFGMRGYYLFGGEPLVRRDIGAIIEYAKHLGFVTAMNTNGSLLAQKAPALAEHLDFAFVSLDHPSQYHDHIRGRRGSFQEVLKGIRLLLGTGHTKVTLVTTISKLNLHQIEAMARFAQGLGVGLSYNTVEPTWTADYHGRAPSVVDDYGLNESEVRFFYVKLLELKHQGYPLMESEWVLRDYAIQKPWVCHFPKIFVYVSPDGFIFPCTHTFHHPLVDLRGTSFTEYFTSDIYRDHVRNAEHCNECLRTCVRMYTYTYALHPLHLLSLTTTAQMWTRQIRRRRKANGPVQINESITIKTAL
jgi:MoaA/NifB/PqqE/SkfB family radical SAM enzyme